MLRHFATLFVYAISALLFVGECAGGTVEAAPAGGVALAQSVPRAAYLNFVAVAGPTRYIAVSDEENQAVLVFDPAGKIVAGLSGFGYPQGLANDDNGDLYVADETNNRVQIYSPGFKGTPRTLRDPGQLPVSVDSFSNGKYIAVVNQNTTSYGPGSVTMYVNGVARATISDPAIQQASFDAFDAKGNLYVTFSPRTSSCPCVGVIASATQGGTTFTPLWTSNAITPYGIEVTPSGRIAIYDEGRNIIDTYDPPSGGSLGSPVARTVLHVQLDAPAQFAFGDGANDLYVANNSDINTLFEFGYPGGGSISSIGVGGVPFGVAVFPKVNPR